MGLKFDYVQTEITTVDTITEVFEATSVAGTQTMITSIDVFNGNAGEAKLKAHNVPAAESADNGNRVGQDVSIPILGSVRPIFGNKVPMKINDTFEIETDVQPVNIRVNFVEIT